MCRIQKLLLRSDRCILKWVVSTKGSLRTYEAIRFLSQVIQRAVEHWSSSAKSKIHWHPSLAANFKHAWKLMWTLALKWQFKFFWLLKRARTITVPHPRTPSSKPFFLGGGYNRLLVEERSKWTTMTLSCTGGRPEPGVQKIQDQIKKLSFKLSGLGAKCPCCSPSSWLWRFLISRGHSWLRKRGNKNWVDNWSM